MSMHHIPVPVLRCHRQHAKVSRGHLYITPQLQNLLRVVEWAQMQCSVHLKPLVVMLNIHPVQLFLVVRET